MSESHHAKLLPFPDIHESKSPSWAKARISSDPHSENVQRQLERLAPSDASVLIVGETGTGKELAARYIHENSGRQGPFIAINCGAFSEHLVEAELFGHEAGAFTGAQQARAGWFETAHGGTLFLDEIGDMPLYLQVKLLRVLQEKQVVRLGSRKPISVDVRLIAATNVELEPAVDARQFRRDLYYRLNVASVRLPPLRERKGDILPLARHFLETYRRKSGYERVALADSAAAALLRHDWPGNIRELENVVHYGLIMSQDGVLESDDLRLPQAAHESAPQMDTHTSSGAPGDACDAVGAGLRRLLQSDRESIHGLVERLLLVTAFEHCQRNQVRTAKRLGLSRNIVRAQLKRHGLLEQSSAGSFARGTQNGAVALV
ncbi:MAG: Fis family transcriptional regulator [Gammaproteobacteria bacterium]|nr:Fis family transcriptional regulator [Gammaproteobacteria bacterium]